MSAQAPGRAGIIFPSDEDLVRFVGGRRTSAGVLPPAGDFSRGRKVTKSPLKTYGSKNSLVLTWNDNPPCLWLVLLPPTLRGRVRYRLLPRFKRAALSGRRWPKAFPWGKEAKRCQWRKKRASFEEIREALPAAEEANGFRGRAPAGGRD